MEIQNYDGFRPLLQSVRLNQLPSILVTVIVAFLFTQIGVIIYRLYFSPIAHFPGPFFAKISYWPEIYHDVWRRGLYIYEIEKMLAKYGPIIRVNPAELSIHDPLFYDQLYVGTRIRKTDNYDRFVGGMNLEGSHAFTKSHALHKQRRRVLDPFFSRSGIRRIESLLRALVIRFEKTLEQHAGQVFYLNHAFTCFSGDVIRSITCDNIDYFMDDKDYSPHWFNMLFDFIKVIPLFIAFPWIFHVVKLVPNGVLDILFPIGADFVKFKDMARGHIVQAKRDKQIANDGNISILEGNSVFRSIINSNMPESELDTDRLTKEAEILFSAGTATTAGTLEFLVYYILALPHLCKMLAEELKSPMAGYPESFPQFTTLEALPVLCATIKEGLRLSFGLMHRLPHCYPDTAIQYKEWVIPPNTPVGMSAYLNHTDPLIWKDPFQFNPDRWLGEIDPRMEKALTPFSKGSRGCLGQNLANAEIYFMLAVLFRPDGPLITLFETNESDVKHVHDFIVPLPKLGTKGVRVLIHGNSS